MSYHVIVSGITGARCIKLIQLLTTYERKLKRNFNFSYLTLKQTISLQDRIEYYMVIRRTVGQLNFIITYTLICSNRKSSEQ